MSLLIKHLGNSTILFKMKVIRYIPTIFELPHFNKRVKSQRHIHTQPRVEISGIRPKLPTFCSVENRANHEVRWTHRQGKFTTLS